MKTRWIAALAAIALWCTPAWGQGQDSIRASGGVLTINLVPSSNRYKVFVDQTITSTVFTNPIPGAVITVLFVQDATGHTVAFGGNISGGCTVTSTASSTTACQFTFDSANNAWTGIGGSGGGITSVSSLPATCTPGVTANVNLTVSPFGVYSCIATNTWSPVPLNGAFSKNVIDMANPKYGLQSDVKFCYGNSSTVAVTNTSNQVSCSTANFTAADVGKHIWATNGCCAILLNITGTVILGSSTVTPIIHDIVSSTAVNVCTSTGACTPVNATASCTTTCIMAWGHNDDAGVASAETDWASSTLNAKCDALQWPASPFFISQPHWNTASTVCSGSEPAIDYSQSVQGWGPGVSLAVIEPTFTNNLSTCTFGTQLFGCFFSLIEVTVSNLGIYGMANGAIGAVAAKHFLVNPGIGSQFQNVAFTGYGGGETSGNLLGIGMFTARASLLSCDGFGNTCIANNANVGNPANSVCLWCFAGDTLGPVLLWDGLGVQGGTVGSTFIDIGGDWGQTSGTALIRVQNVGTFRSYGGHGFEATGHNNLTANGGNAIVTSGGAGNVIDLHGGIWNNAGTLCTNCTALSLGVSGDKAYLEGTTLVGKGTGGNAFGVAGTGIFDIGGNTFSGGSTATSGSVFGQASITGTVITAAKLVLSAGWGTTAAWTALTGNTTVIQGTITASGTGQAANPTITYTFPTPFLVAPNACFATQVGGTQTAVANPFTPGTPTATSVVLTYNGTPGAGNTLIVQIRCGND